MRKLIDVAVIEFGIILLLVGALLVFAFFEVYSNLMRLTKEVVEIRKLHEESTKKAEGK